MTVCKPPFVLAALLGVWIGAHASRGDQPPAGGEASAPRSPLRLEISLAKREYPFRGAIPLTITYTNTSQQTVELLANGLAPGQGFAGETFEVTSGAGTKTYTVVATEPAVQRVTLKPGECWRRTIDELAVELSRAGAIDGRVPRADDPLPDPFGRPDEYTIRLRYDSTIRAQPRPAFNGRLLSNTVRVVVVR